MITEALLRAGFKRTNYNDYNCVLRLHEIHYLFWSENLHHFGIGVNNVSGKREPGGFFKECTIVMIPRPIYTVEGAMEMLKAIRG